MCPICGLFGVGMGKKIMGMETTYVGMGWELGWACKFIPMLIKLERPGVEP